MSARRWRYALALSGACLAQAGISGAEPIVEKRAPDDIGGAGQNGDGMDTHLFRPAVDSKGFISVNGSDILGANDISFGLVLDYGRNIMRTNDDREACGNAGEPACPSGGPAKGRGVDSLVKNSFQGTFGFDYGIANLAVVGITVPVVLMAGDEANELGENGAIYSTGKLDAQKISTVALHGKFRLTRVDRGPGLAIIIQGGVPVGDAPRDLGADPGGWYWPRVALENRFGSTGRFKIGVNVGYPGPHRQESEVRARSGRPRPAQGRRVRVRKPRHLRTGPLVPRA